MDIDALDTENEFYEQLVELQATAIQLNESLADLFKLWNEYIEFRNAELRDDTNVSVP